MLLLLLALTQTFDNEGRFVPEKFEELFSKYDRDNKGGLSWRDIQEMVSREGERGGRGGGPAGRWWRSSDGDIGVCMQCVQAHLA
jgi:hypothetical protein